MSVEDGGKLSDGAKDHSAVTSPSSCSLGENATEKHDVQLTEHVNSFTSSAVSTERAFPEQNALGTADPKSAPISKSQLKKLRKQAEWEAGRDARKLKRKEKLKAKRERDRDTRKPGTANGEDNATKRMDRSVLEGGQESVSEATRTSATERKGDDAQAAIPISLESNKLRKPARSTQVPITILFDCQFDELMKDGELKSLAGQLTRCYSDNRRSRYRAHLVISSYGGRLRERFEGLLEGQHRAWKNVRFVEENYVAAAETARTWMREPDGGIIAGALQPHSQDNADKPSKAESDEHNITATNAGEVVYLSSDSPHTIKELSPFSTYIIGGLVDRNRHKGICYKSAVENNIRTARLPISEFIDMSTRAVLATNHVNDIMLKWLEFGDWGKAFFEVIPKRKGGKLKDRDEESESMSEVNTVRDLGYSEESHPDPAAFRKRKLMEVHIGGTPIGHEVKRQKDS